VSRLLRGTLPVVAAFAVATAITLPAYATQQADAGQPATGPARSAQWWLASLQVPQAWAAAPGQGTGVTVAVLSTGVDASHQDLSGAVLTGPDYSASGRAPGGPYWGFEGTAVAGLIAGRGHGAGGATGSTGVAPRARILSVRVTLEYDDPLNSDTAITRRLPDAIAAGIRYAVDHGARVIALPLDPGTLGFAANGDPAAANGSAAERAAVSYAVAHDVVLVAPAGDNGANSGTVNYPAAYPGVLAVGATTRDGQLAPFTNTGSYVALTAPGTALTVAAPDGGYSTLSSTDMSAALAAGVAALIRSRFPALTAAQVVQAMERGTGTRPGSRPAAGTGHGALDAAGGLTAAAAIAPRQAPAAPGPTASGPRLTQAPRASARRSSAGTLAGSLLRDTVIVAVALIAGLAGALALSTARRRRRAAAARPPRTSQAGGSHARRPRAALPAAQGAAGTRITIWGTHGAPASDHGSGPWRGTAGTNGAGPRLAPPLARAVGRTARARHGKRGDTAEPPWEAASPPGTVPAADPWAPRTPRAALPPAGRGPRAAAGQAVPPWELAGGEMAAAPVPADLNNLPVSNSGPMYIWNPSASGPLPILRDEDDAGR
jgi:subtilisin family serine protease